MEVVTFIRIRKYLGSTQICEYLAHIFLKYVLPKEFIFWGYNPVFDGESLQGYRPVNENNQT